MNMLISPPISHINHLRQKLVEAFVCYFLSNFYLSSNDSPSKTRTNGFFSSKKLFTFLRYSNSCISVFPSFFPVSHCFRG